MLSYIYMNTDIFTYVDTHSDTFTQSSFGKTEMNS